MDNKIVIPIIIGLSFFVAYTIFYPTLFDPDSYAWAGYVCDKWEMDTVMPAFQLSEPLIPCDVAGIKLVLALSFVISSIILYFAARVWTEKNAWLAPLLAMASPLWLGIFSQFEPEALAVPFMALGLFFYSKYVKAKQVPSSNLLLCRVGIFLSFGIATLFWRGGILYFFALAPILLEHAIVTIAVWATSWKELWWKFIPNDMVTENIPLVGFLFWLPLLLSFFITKKKEWLLPLIVFAIFGIMASKYAVYGIPLAAIVLAVHWEKFELGPKAILRLSKYGFTKEWFQYLIVGISLASVAGLFIFLPFQVPSTGDLAAVQTVSTLAISSPIANDWDYGWLLKFYDLNALTKAGPPHPDYNNRTYPVNDKNVPFSGWAFTVQDVNCRFERGFDNSFVRLHYCD